MCCVSISVDQGVEHRTITLILCSIADYLLTGEGWCLPVAEAMSVAMPVIVSNYSGPAAYANDENAFLIPVHTTPDGYADPDVTVLAAQMRYVRHHQEEARKKGMAARETIQSLSPEYVVGKMKERLLDLVDRRGWNV